MIEHEEWIDDHSLMIGYIEEEDASFDHAFGTEKREELIVKHFTIIVYIDGIDYDVTKALSSKTIELYKTQFLENYKEKQYQDKMEKPY